MNMHFSASTATPPAREGRWIAISGLLFVGAWIVGLLIANPPPATAAIDSLVTYYRANTAMAMWQAYVANGLTGILLLVFIAALHSALRRADRGGSTLSSMLLGAGLVVVSLSCLEALFVLVLVNVVGLNQGAGVVRALLQLNVDLDAFKLPILGIMIAAASLLASRASALPRWLAWVGAGEAVLLVVASWSALFPSEILSMVLYVSGVGLLVWTTAVSVVMRNYDAH